MTALDLDLAASGVGKQGPPERLLSTMEVKLMAPTVFVGVAQTGELALFLHYFYYILRMFLRFRFIEPILEITLI